MKHGKLIALLVLATIAVVAIATLPVADSLQRFLEWVEGMGLWGPVIVALAYIPATVLFVPGTILTLGAGALFGVVIGSIAISIGSTLGSTAAFLVSRFMAREWVSEKVKGNAKFEALDKAVGDNGFKIVLLTRLSPLFPYNMLAYPYGITNVKLRDFFVASWIGMLPGTIMYVYLGSAIGSIARLASGESRESSPLRWVIYSFGFLATVILTITIARIASRAIHQEIPAAQDDSPPIPAKGSA